MTNIYKRGMSFTDPRNVNNVYNVQFISKMEAIRMMLRGSTIFRGVK
jgi:hypothetical protein